MSIKYEAYVVIAKESTHDEPMAETLRVYNSHEAAFEFVKRVIAEDKKENPDSEWVETEKDLWECTRDNSRDWIRICYEPVFADDKEQE